jgi:hypothetical protein
MELRRIGSIPRVAVSLPMYTSAPTPRSCSRTPAVRTAHRSRTMQSRRTCSGYVYLFRIGPTKSAIEALVNMLPPNRRPAWEGKLIDYLA